MIHTPDYWVLIKTPDCYKVLAGWKGGYLYGDQWRLSSGVTNIIELKDMWLITNQSGSQYYCGKYNEGLIGIMMGAYTDLIERANCARVSIEDYEHCRDVE